MIYKQLSSIRFTNREGLEFTRVLFEDLPFWNMAELYPIDTLWRLLETL